MKEQFTALAQECFIMGEKEFAGKPVGFNYGKFTKLIVAEMYDFIMDESAKDNGIPDLGTVNQHFGVEE